MFHLDQSGKFFVTVYKKKIECISEACHAVVVVSKMIVVALRIQIRKREVRHVGVGGDVVDVVIDKNVNIFPDPDTVDAVQKQPEGPHVGGPVHTSGLRHDTKIRKKKEANKVNKNGNMEDDDAQIEVRQQNS